MGNLNFRTTSDTLTGHLSAAGEIVDVYIATDRDTGRPRGFAFVTFAEESQAQKAIQMFNGVEFEGRPLNINEARERERGQRPPPGRPRPYSPKGPPRGGGGGGGYRGGPPQRGGFRDDFHVPSTDLNEEVSLDGSSWGENRESHWGDDMDGGGGGGRGKSKKKKTKGSRRRIRARKKDF